MDHLNTGQIRWFGKDLRLPDKRRHHLVTDLRIQGGGCVGNVKWVEPGTSSYYMPVIEFNRTIDENEFTGRGTGSVRDLSIATDPDEEGGRITLKYRVYVDSATNLEVEMVWLYPGSAPPFNPNVVQNEPRL